MTQTLLVHRTTDYSALAFDPPVDAVTFTNVAGGGAKAIFAGSQIDLGYLTADATITGSTSPNYVVFNIAADGVFDTSFSFVDWQPGDRVVINGADGGEELHGTAADDIMRGFAGDDVIYTSAGTDQLFGGAGNDYLITTYDPDPSDDTIDGGAGRDTLVAEDTDLLSANIVDVETALVLGFVYFRADQFGGEGKINVIKGGDAEATAWVIGDTIDLSAVTVRGSVVTYIGRLGTAFTATGSNAQDFFFSNAGDDELHGGDGGDVFLHISGNDACYGDAGNDEFSGGPAESPGVGSIYDGGAGTDKIRVWRDTPVDLSGALVTSIEILEFSTTVTTGAQVTLGGHQIGAGSDTISRIAGGDGADTLQVTGNAVDLSAVRFENWDQEFDRVAIIGTAGADMLLGSRVADYFTGGDGADIFAFAKWPADLNGAIVDFIEDFQQGADIIDLSRIDADTSTAGNARFTFIAGEFSGAAGELRAVEGDGITTIEGDIDGGGLADFRIVLTGAMTLTAADFTL